jgi:DNA-binding SARP family transcriptional activator
VWYGVLGSLEVLDDGGVAVDVGGAQPRALLAALLLARGRVVAADWLIEAVWPDAPPASAVGTLQSYVSRLRRVLEPARDRRAPARVIVSEPAGYRLDVPADRVDFRRFEDLADRGRARLDAGDAAGARDALVEAAALWRGPALAEFADHEFARGMATRLEERRLVAVEDRIDAELRLGHHAALIAELSELIDRHPLREALRGHLALALYRSGRQAEALRAIEDTRRALRDELGVDPGPALRDLERRILAHDPGLEPERPAPAPVPAPAPAAAAWSGDVVPGATLVGRGQELAQLCDALREAMAGTARLVLVEGEPGIGKTRLLEEVGATAAGAGAVVLWGRCHEGEGAPAFWPWLPVVRELVAALPEGERAATTAGELGRLLGVASPPEPEVGAGPVPGGGRFPLFDAVAGLLERCAAAAPVVVLLDDLQWADVASLELFGFLAQRLGSARVLAVGSLRELEVGRNDAVVAAVATAMRRPGTRRLHLHGVDPAATGVLVERAAGAPASAATVAAIHARSDGNPFFVGELARLLASDRHLTADPASAAIPAGVREVVRRRLAQLPASTVELLDVAAVAGRDFDLRILARASALSVDRCLDDLEPAVTTRLLLAVPDEPAAFRFAHALVREAVLDELSPLRRARLHQRVADAIEEAEGDSEDAAEIVAAHLWSAAPLGLERRAAEALERAADVATRRYAYEAADDLLERAAQLRRSAGSSQQDAEAELAVLGRLASVRRILHGYQGGWERSPLDRARELARRTGRHDLLVGFLWAEWAGAATSCRFDAALRMADELRRIGEESDDPAVQAMVDHCLGVQAWHLGRIDEAVRYTKRAEARTDADIEALLESGPLTRAFALTFAEMAGELEDDGGRYEALGRAYPDPFSQIIVLSNGAYAGVMVGDFVRVERLARTAATHDPNRAASFFTNGNRMFLAAGLAHLGRPEDALAIYADALPGYLATGARTIVPVHLTNRAYAQLEVGRADLALGSIAEAWAVIEERGERSNVPTVMLYEAIVHHRTGAPADDVRLRLAKAHEAATAQGAHGVARHVARRAADLGFEVP